MTWNVENADRSLSNGDCLICKKLKTAKEIGIALSFAGEKFNKRGFICRECFERDILPFNGIDEEQKNACGICFVCEEKFENVPYDAAKTKDTYTFEIIEQEKHKNNSVFCVHVHKDCFLGSASDEWIFNE